MLKNNLYQFKTGEGMSSDNSTLEERNIIRKKLIELGYPSSVGWKMSENSLGNGWGWDRKDYKLQFSFSIDNIAIPLTFKEMLERLENNSQTYEIY